MNISEFVVQEQGSLITKKEEYSLILDIIPFVLRDYIFVTRSPGSYH